MPLVLHLQGLLVSGIIPKFRYNNCWNLAPDCVELIKDTWVNGMRCDNVEDCRNKLNHYRFQLMEWRNHPPNWPKLIKEKVSLLNSISAVPMSAENREKANCIQEEIDDLTRREATYWSQRAKSHWLRDGDRNKTFSFSSFLSKEKEHN
ncbi:uncharacterized protein [Rutidosis leptorrhynchoides]|uniref:uncharacterized protein n=1 Tax=Rutidosis leptorrhynchoides TaxID=125765 RepID=UPI003A9A5E6A